MKLEEVKQHISPKAFADLNVDLSRAITSDEFNKHYLKTDYRGRAVNRLVEIALPFYSETNILGEIGKRFLQMVCPYCATLMPCSYGGGASSGGHSWNTLDFRCPACGANADIALPPDGIHFVPKEK